jgi:hypothetical protein
LPDGTYIFRPKIPIWVNFGGPSFMGFAIRKVMATKKKKKKTILEGLEVEKVGLFYGHLEYITTIWYITYMAFW